MFRKYYFAVAAVALAVPAVAQAEEAAVRTFVHDGVEYSYTTEVKGNARILRGTADNGRTPFVLRVTDRRVDGSFDGNAVQFSRARVQSVTVEQVAVR